MTDENNQVTVDRVDFSQLFYFPRILTAALSALQPGRMIIALLMVVVLITFGRVWDGIAGPTVSPRGVPFEAAEDFQIEDGNALGVFEATVYEVTSSFEEIMHAVFAISVTDTVAATLGLFVTIPQEMWNSQKWFAIVFGFVFIFVFAIGGGAIARMAGCQFAAEERLRISEAFDFSLGHWMRLTWSILLPLIIVLGLCAVIIVLGLLLFIPVIDIVGGVVYGFALIFGFLIAFLLIGYAFGFPMLVPAVACENCDSADAMQRAYAYVVGRPLHLLVYWATMLFGLALGFVVVNIVVHLMLESTTTLFGMFTDHPATAVTAGADMSWHESWTASIITFWRTVVVCLVAGYVFSYVFSSSTIMYLLMRRACDGQEPTEIWRPQLPQDPEPDASTEEKPKKSKSKK